MGYIYLHKKCMNYFPLARFMFSADFENIAEVKKFPPLNFPSLVHGPPPSSLVQDVVNLHVIPVLLILLWRANHYRTLLGINSRIRSCCHCINWVME